MTQEENEPHVKRPEFIILEAETEEPGSKGNGDFISAVKHLKKANFPPWLRIASFLVSVMVLMFAICVFIASLICTVLAVVTVGVNRDLNSMMMGFWKLYYKSLVFTLGFFIAAFSPAFGIGIIYFYLLLHGEKVQEWFQKRFMRYKG